MFCWFVCLYNFSATFCGGCWSWKVFHYVWFCFLPYFVVFGRYKTIQKVRINFPIFISSFSPSVHSLGLARIAVTCVLSLWACFVLLSSSFPPSLHISSRGWWCWGMGVLLQTFACAACLACIPIQRNGSVLPTRVSHVSSEKPIGATQLQGGNPQTMGCNLSKCVILMMFTKGRITITYYTQYSIIYSNSVNCYRISHILNLQTSKHPITTFDCLLAVLLKCFINLFQRFVQWTNHTWPHSQTIYYKKEN